MGRKPCCGDCGAGHYFVLLILRHLLLDIFLFLLSIAQLLGELCYNIRNSANVFPLSCALLYITQILLSLQLLLSLWAKRSGRKKICHFFFHSKFAALHLCISARCNASLTILQRILYCANPFGITLLMVLRILLQKSSITRAVLAGDGTAVKQDEGLLKQKQNKK